MRTQRTLRALVTTAATAGVIAVGVLVAPTQALAAQSPASAISATTSGVTSLICHDL